MKRIQNCASIFLFLFACTLFSSNQVCAEPGPLEIGVIVPLSGGISAYGTAIRNGIVMAKDDDPNVKAIRFIFEDDQYEASQSLAAYRKLVARDKVSIVWTFGSVSGNVLAPIVERNNVILLNSGQEFDFAVGRSHVIRTLGPTTLYTNKLLDYLREQGHREFRIIYTETPYLKHMSDAFQSGLRENETLVIEAAVNPAETDFRTIISKLRIAGVTNIGLLLFPEQVAQFARQAREQNYISNAFGSDFFESALPLLGESDLMNGWIYPDNDVNIEFRRKYEERFGNVDQLTFAANAYDTARILGGLGRFPSPVSSEQVLHFFSSLPGGRGVLGDYNFVDNIEVGKFIEFPVRLKKVQKSQSVSIDD